MVKTKSEKIPGGKIGKNFLRGLFMANYLIHFNPNHDPKTGRFSNAVKNYSKVINNLSDDEFKLFTGDPNKTKKQDIDEMKKLIRIQPNYKDSLAIISKYGNVTLANLNSHPFWGDQWSMGWATDPKSRGTGITQANIKEAIQEIRKYSDVPISAIIDSDNIASIKTAEKAGFKPIIDVYNPESGKMEKKYVYGDDADKLKQKLSGY